jgi:hypothetical protein
MRQNGCPAGSSRTTRLGSFESWCWARLPPSCSICWATASGSSTTNHRAKDAAGRASAAKEKYIYAISMAAMIGGNKYAKLQESSQQAYLDNAMQERDAFIQYLRDLRESGQISNTQLAKVTTVTAAWDPKTGKVYLGWKINKEGPAEWCAEDDCAQQAAANGVDTRSLQFTKTIRPRNLQVVNVCVNCQKDYPEDQFSVSGAEGEPGGEWDRARTQAQSEAQTQAEQEAEAEAMAEARAEAFAEAEAIGEGEEE